MNKKIVIMVLGLFLVGFFAFAQFAQSTTPNWLSLVDEPAMVGDNIYYAVAKADIVNGSISEAVIDASGIARSKVKKVIPWTSEEIEKQERQLTPVTSTFVENNEAYVLFILNK